MCSSFTKWLALAIVAVLASCGDAPEARVGIDLTEVQFEFFDEEEGVHPSTVVLKNPNNPFRVVGVDADAKFTLSARPEPEPSDEAGPPEEKDPLATNAAQFYGWATALANEATGVNQLFAAQALQRVWQEDEVAVEDRGRLFTLTVAAFQSVLDNFPDALLFNEDGNLQGEAATSALIGMLEMNAPVEGDWILVEVPDLLDNDDDEPPRVRAIRASDIPREEFLR